MLRVALVAACAALVLAGHANAQNADTQVESDAPSAEQQQAESAYQEKAALAQLGEGPGHRRHQQQLEARAARALRVPRRREHREVRGDEPEPVLGPRSDDRARQPRVERVLRVRRRRLREGR